MESLAPDTVWSVFSNTSSLEDFKTNAIPKVFICPHASENILKSLDVVKRLLAHSYFEYSFTDVAMQYSIFSLEKAMRERYEDIHNKSSKKQSFKTLIDHFFDNGYFEVYNKEVLTQLRNIRNGNAHEVQHSQAGTIAFNKASVAIDLINDLYLDPQSRDARKKYISSISDHFKKSQDDGYILKRGDEKFIIFKVAPLLFDNTQTPNLLHLSCIPIFELSDSLARTPSLFNITLSEHEINDEGTLTGKDETSCKIELYSIGKDYKKENQIKYERWLGELNSLKDLGILMTSIDFDINKTFVRLRRELLLKHCRLI